MRSNRRLFGCTCASNCPPSNDRDDTGSKDFNMVGTRARASSNLGKKRAAVFLRAVS